MPIEAVIEEKDKDFSIYEVPLSLVEHGLDELIVRKLGLKAGELNLDDWRDLLHRLRNPEHEISIAVVGKYAEHRDAYKSIYEALDHAGIANRAQVRIQRIHSEAVEREGPERLLSGRTTASWCPAASASGASKARSRRSASPANAASRSSASAWACSARWSSSPATCSGWSGPTRPSSTRTRRTR